MTINNSAGNTARDPNGISTCELFAEKVPQARQDYNGMPLSEWKDALRQDVESRFGQPPEGLVDVGEPGW